jgi:hypothetical protein
VSRVCEKAGSFRLREASRKDRGFRGVSLVPFYPNHPSQLRLVYFESGGPIGAHGPKGPDHHDWMARFPSSPLHHQISPSPLPGPKVTLSMTAVALILSGPTNLMDKLGFMRSWRCCDTTFNSTRVTKLIGCLRETRFQDFSTTPHPSSPGGAHIGNSCDNSIAFYQFSQRNWGWWCRKC